MAIIHLRALTGWPRTTWLLADAWLGLLAAGPRAALAQTDSDQFRPRTLPKRSYWLTGFSAGLALPVGPVADGPIKRGTDLTTTVEYAFDRPQGFWLRGALDVIQYSTIKSLSGPGYAYTLDLNNTATSVVGDVGYRQPLGRVAPYGFVGGGGAFLSSSRLDVQQNGPTQSVGDGSRFVPVARAGLGLEYRLYRSNVIIYLELTGTLLPEQRVEGERVAFLQPLLGLKFPLF